MTRSQRCGPRRSCARANGQDAVEGGKPEAMVINVNTHRYINDPSRNGQFNTLVWTETVDAACGE